MTVRELSKLYYLNREIEEECARLRELECKVLPGSQALAGSGGSGGTARTMERYVVEIADLRRIIETKIELCLYERCRLEQYIADINDSLVRQIMVLRFINGLPWRQVAASLGGGNTADSVRMACTRYLNGQGRAGTRET